MKRILTAISLIILLGLGNATARAQANPETVVANLYRAAKLKSVAEMGKIELQKYFDSELASIIGKAERGENGLDFDVLYNAQDLQIKNFRIIKAAPQTAAISNWNVTFTNFGKKEWLNIELNNFDGKGWKISEITYKDGSTLTEVLSSD